MELIVLGAGPAYSDRPGALGSAYLVRSTDGAIVLDLGQGTFTNLARAVEPSALEGVLVSHLHPDHFIDLVPLRHYLRWEFRPPRRVRLFAPAGIERRLDALLDEPGFTSACLELGALRPGERRVGPFVVEAALVRHTAESYAFRVSLPDRTGPGLVYSGDCGDPDDLVPLVRAGDVLLVEASFGPGPVPPGAEHLDGPMIGELAARTRPSRVLLTHLQMGFDETETVARVAERYPGPVSFVWPGDAVAID
ncbi:MAG TPA: MBL fold metallo-hydrolase [Candidatus Limnocylindrales bacterium]|nr:MBL fold metallo-hydrolase [Candidatus Limnocylindrales bacterium]